LLNSSKLRLNDAVSKESNMIRLFEYLDADGWLETPGTRTARKGGWIYAWQAGLPGMLDDTALLVRHLCQREEGAALELELFIVKGEARCLEVASELHEGKHPASPQPDPRTGKRIGYL
jgi:hypothetical protein